MFVNDAEQFSGKFDMEADKENSPQQSNGSVSENGIIQEERSVNSIILTIPSVNTSTVFSSLAKNQHIHVENSDFSRGSFGENHVLQEETLPDFNFLINPSVNSSTIFPLSTGDSNSLNQSRSLSETISSGPSLASTSVSARP